jgi:uncharacterized protein
MNRREFATSLLLVQALRAAHGRMQALIVDGRNNHEWQTTTPVLRRLLEETRRFEVRVATAPSTNDRMESFHPDFNSVRLIVLNYTDLGNGGVWAPQVKSDFEQAVRGGCGVVVYHAASSAFADWHQFNQITGLGGWGGRDERWGPHLYWRDGSVIAEPGAGPGGHHGQKHSFVVRVRMPDHPILRGLPVEWTHAPDELYDTMRGPAENLEVLATAWSDPATGGTGLHEPMLFTVRYGEGRVFHTTLGHDLQAIGCTGFIATFQRGSEWAAKGRVTQSAPLDFRTGREVRTRAT